MACTPEDGGSTADSLPPLGANAKLKWRALRVLIDFPDLPHAARRLHLSQAALRALLEELCPSIDPAQLRIEDRKVLLPDSLRHFLERTSRPPSSEQGMSAVRRPGSISIPDSPALETS